MRFPYFVYVLPLILALSCSDSPKKTKPNQNKVRIREQERENSKIQIGLIASERQAIVVRMRSLSAEDDRFNAYADKILECAWWVVHGWWSVSVHRGPLP